MNKHDIFKQIKTELEKTLANTERQRNESQHEANQHKGRMQSRYDTFKEEAQMMVAAHEVRMAELRASLAQVQAVLDRPSVFKPTDTIRVGAVIALEANDGTRRRHVLSPTGGGIQVVSGSTELMVITPDSPIGKRLVGLKMGDEIEIDVGGNKRNYQIVEVE
ncbi:MAG: GreA/GreB family elongation factor [Patescibacteria group bacterium]|nr:GreA/GreB family elongation factor [Patescibacteria group bacterium]